MSKKSLMITLVLLIVLVAGGTFVYNQFKDDVAIYPTAISSSSSSSASTASEERSYEKAPILFAADSFTVYNAQGDAVELSDFFGKPIVLNFWASWCPPCKMEMPYFQTAYDTYGEDVVFLMVSMTDGQRETQETADAYLAEEAYSFPVYYDLTYDAAATYGVRALPTSIFINTNGEIVKKVEGSLTEKMLASTIDLIFPAD